MSVCPSCGYCPTCGRQRFFQPHIGPWWGVNPPTWPNYYIGNNGAGNYTQAVAVNGQLNNEVCNCA